MPYTHVKNETGAYKAGRVREDRIYCKEVLSKPLIYRIDSKCTSPKAFKVERALNDFESQHIIDAGNDYGLKRSTVAQTALLDKGQLSLHLFLLLQKGKRHVQPITRFELVTLSLRRRCNNPYAKSAFFPFFPGTTSQKYPTALTLITTSKKNRSHEFHNVG